MRTLTSDEIINLLENLIGNTDPEGDSILDEYVAEANRNVVDIGNWVLDTVRETARHCGSPKRTSHQIGFDAKCALMEWRDWLSARLDEMDGGAE